MFIGAAPQQAVEQVTRSVPFAEWRQVFVGCSGSFRLERAVKALHPTVTVHSNDVSLLSCALGALATGAEIPIRFIGRLAFIEDALAGRDFAARVGAIEVALEMAKYKRDNEFARAHFAHYRDRFADFLGPVSVRLATFFKGLDIADFQSGDFREQGRRACDAGGGVLAYPPLERNGYETLYRFLNENTDWPRPVYDVWDPAHLDGWLGELDDMRGRYCILTDQILEHHEPATVYRGNATRPIYAYADRAATSVRRSTRPSQPFRYTNLDPDSLTKRSRVEIITANSAQMNFLKDIYLAKGIAHTSGTANFLVLIDGHLAGGFILREEKHASNSAYMLCDFALSPKSRVSKLIAMLATSETVTGRLEIMFLERIETVLTNAFTDKPVSMKYRGVFELVGRSPGKLSYVSRVRRRTPDALYREWFQQYVANAGHKGAASRPKAAGEKRPLYEGGAVQPICGEPQTGRVPDQPSAGPPG
jgi:hypothetical protein